MRAVRHPATCRGRGPPALVRVTLLGRGGLVSRRAKAAMMGPTVIEAPLDASSAPDSAAASSVRLCAQPIRSPLTGGGQAAASEPGEPEPEPGEPEPEYAQKSAANQSAGRGGQSKPQLSGGGCLRARRPNTAFCVACFPYSIDSERNNGAQCPTWTLSDAPPRAPDCNRDATGAFAGAKVGLHSYHFVAHCGEMTPRLVSALKSLSSVSPPVESPTRMRPFRTMIRRPR